ncbi:hypothetical protein [Gryllotalpicola sp.]|uniref:zinc ribbon domain-containing protein n=1 Tax=Gryllotalpicola sp. TaxID=1932787 RepID=UPI002624C9AE|nr:hypothetical protein [Gryllotalpicola sp.]
MKASPEHQQQLLRLQDADSALLRIEHAIAALPELKAIEGLLGQADLLRHNHAEVIGRVEDAEAGIARLESDLKIVTQRRERDVERLQASSSPKDIDALENELAALHRRADDLETAELEAMGRLEDAKTDAAKIVETQDQVRGQLATVMAERDSKLSALEADRGAKQGERNAIAEGIPHELIELYEKQRSRYGVGAAAVLGGVNRGSNLQLAPGDLAAVRSAAEDDVIVDSESGAILIRSENS